MKIIIVHYEIVKENRIQYIIVDNFEEAERLFFKHYPNQSIKSMELLTESVINMWAQ